MTESILGRGDRVAVYGSLKSGFHNHSVLADAKLLGETTLPGFKMYSLGGFPGVNESSDDSIQVEVYELPDAKTGLHLDRLEGHPHFYKREQRESSLGLVWVYVLQQDMSHKPERVVPDGIWKNPYS